MCGNFLLFEFSCCSIANEHICVLSEVSASALLQSCFSISLTLLFPPSLPYPRQLLCDSSDVLSLLADDEAVQPGRSRHLHHHHTLRLHEGGLQVTIKFALAHFLLCSHTQFDPHLGVDLCQRGSQLVGLPSQDDGLGAGVQRRHLHRHPRGLQDLLQSVALWAHDVLMLGLLHLHRDGGGLPLLQEEEGEGGQEELETEERMQGTVRDGKEHNRRQKEERRTSAGKQEGQEERRDKENRRKKRIESDRKTRGNERGN